ncbi:MFS transporter [bacterium]|nr:MAG: MFS transporter [bacterium]
MSISAYSDVIRNIPSFRRLWLSQIVSNFGDWVGLLAIYAIIQQFGQSPFLLGLIIIVKLMSFAFFSPIAGYITDAYNRKMVMFWSDIARAVIVAGFMLVNSKDVIFLTYVLIALQMFFSAMFEPAKSSTVPVLLKGEDLVTGNIITSFSWSAIFTIGMAVGGMLTEWFGFHWVFVINVITYLVSAYFVYRIEIPESAARQKEHVLEKKPIQDIINGFKYLKNHPKVARPALAKATYTSFMGGLLYLIILYSEDVLLMGSLGVGLIYSVRGLGTGVGPILGRKWFTNHEKWLSLIGFSMMMGGFFYFWMGLFHSIIVVLLLAFIAHLATGFNWVMSTVLVQQRTEHEFMGRVFSFEWLMFNMSQSLSVFFASMILEHKWLDINQTMMLFSCLLIINGIWWLFLVGKRDEKES